MAVKGYSSSNSTAYGEEQREPQGKGCRSLLGAGKAKEIGSSLQPPERNVDFSPGSSTEGCAFIEMGRLEKGRMQKSRVWLWAFYRFKVLQIPSRNKVRSHWLGELNSDKAELEMQFVLSLYRCSK